LLTASYHKGDPKTERKEERNANRKSYDLVEKGKRNLWKRRQRRR